MTLSEFKAWFEGYTEGLDGAPTEKQFKRIKAKVAEITGTPISQTVFIDRYRDFYRTYWNGGSGMGSFNVAGSYAPQNGLGTVSLMMHAIGATSETDRYIPSDKNQTVEWDAHAAMYAAGKLDAQEAA